MRPQFFLFIDLPLQPITWSSCSQAIALTLLSVRELCRWTLRNFRAFGRSQPVSSRIYRLPDGAVCRRCFDFDLSSALSRELWLYG